MSTADVYLEAEVSKLTREEIRECSSQDQLYRWHHGLYDLSDNIESKIEAYRNAGTADEDWLRRASGKVAWANIGMKTIGRRCAELGFDRPVRRGDRDRETIRRLQAQVHSDNKAETNRIISWLTENFAGNDLVSGIVEAIGAGAHRRREVPA